MSEFMESELSKKVGAGWFIWMLLITIIFWIIQENKSVIVVEKIDNPNKENSLIFSSNTAYENFKLEYATIKLVPHRWNDYTILYELVKDESGNVVNKKEIHRWSSILDTSTKQAEKERLAKSGEIKEPLEAKEIKDGMLEVRTRYGNKIVYTGAEVAEDKKGVAKFILEKNNEIMDLYFFESKPAGTEIRDEAGNLIAEKAGNLGDSDLNSLMRNIRLDSVNMKELGYNVYSRVDVVHFNLRGWIFLVFLMPLLGLIILIKAVSPNQDEIKTDEKQSGKIDTVFTTLNRATPYILLWVAFLGMLFYCTVPMIMEYIGEGIGNTVKIIGPYVGGVAFLLLLFVAWRYREADKLIKEENELKKKVVEEWFEAHRAHALQSAFLISEGKEDKVAMLPKPPPIPNFGGKNSIQVEYNPGNVVDAEYEEEKDEDKE